MSPEADLHKRLHAVLVDGTRPNADEWSEVLTNNLDHLQPGKVEASPTRSSTQTRSAFFMATAARAANDAPPVFTAATTTPAKPKPAAHAAPSTKSASSSAPRPRGRRGVAVLAALLAITAIALSVFLVQARTELEDERDRASSLGSRLSSARSDLESAEDNLADVESELQASAADLQATSALMMEPISHGTIWSAQPSGLNWKTPDIDECTLAECPATGYKVGVTCSAQCRANVGTRYSATLTYSPSRQAWIGSDSERAFSCGGVSARTTFQVEIRIHSAQRSDDGAHWIATRATANASFRANFSNGCHDGLVETTQVGT